MAPPREHINEIEIIMADGSIVVVGAKHDTLRKQRELVSDLVYFHSLEIEERMPAGLLKRRPGYAIERCLQDPNDLTQLLCGSEGTLAAIISAELKIVPLPQRAGLGLIFFASVARSHAGHGRTAGLKTCRDRTYRSRAAGSDRGPA